MFTTKKKNPHSIWWVCRWPLFSVWLGNFGCKMKLRAPVNKIPFTYPLWKHNHKLLTLIKALPRREAARRICELHLRAELVRKHLRPPDAPGLASRLSLRNTIARARPVSRTWKHVVLRVGDRKAEIQSTNTNTRTWPPAGCTTIRRKAQVVN